MEFNFILIRMFNFLHNFYFNFSSWIISIFNLVISSFMYTLQVQNRIILNNKHWIILNRNNVHVGSVSLTGATRNTRRWYLPIYLIHYLQVIIYTYVDMHLYKYTIYEPINLKCFWFQQNNNNNNSKLRTNSCGRLWLLPAINSWSIH